MSFGQCKKINMKKIITAMKTNAVITTDHPCILVYSGKVLDRLFLPSLYQLSKTCLQTKLNILDFFLDLAAPTCLGLAEILFFCDFSTSSTGRSL